MANSEKKAFLFYYDWMEPLKLLSDAQCGRLIKALAMIERNDPEDIPELDEQSQMALAFMGQTVARDRSKWEEISRKRTQAGAKGGQASAASRQQKKNDREDAHNQAATANDAQSGCEEAELRAFGHYQRVLMTDAEYGALVDEFGEDKVTAAIADVDASAEASDNSKGWKCWEAVVRRNLSNGWFPKKCEKNVNNGGADDLEFAN